MGALNKSCQSDYARFCVCRCAQLSHKNVLCSMCGREGCKYLSATYDLRLK